MSPVETLNLIVAAGGLIMMLAAVVFAYDLVCKKGEIFAEIIRPHAHNIIIAITLSATALSLFYSDVLGFVPCSLCWFQRIFMYPQLILATAGKFYNDTKMLPRYGTLLSIFGLGFALYHYALKLLPKESLPCPADGAADCTIVIIDEFGFVNFPFVSAAMFALLITLYRYMQR